jgi:hypothetical protein
MNLLLADIDEVLLAHHADTMQVVAAGQQLIFSAFGQIVDECPTADHASLADSLAEVLHRRLRERIGLKRKPMAKS